MSSLRQIIENEAVINLQDVVFRRTDLWEQPDLAMEIAPDIADLFGWSEHKTAEELASLASVLARPTPANAAVGN